MVERLRVLLEQPLDPRVARAVVVLGCVVAAGFAGAVALGVWAGGPASSTSAARSVPTAAVALPRDPAPANPPAPPRRQDPQDEPGSSAAARAERELATHRALQHVPYREGEVRIDLVGAKGSEAVLAVSAPTLALAHQGWRAFLHRYRDAGHSYLPRFKPRGGAKAQRAHSSTEQRGTR